MVSSNGSVSSTAQLVVGLTEFAAEKTAPVDVAENSSTAAASSAHASRTEWLPETGETLEHALASPWTIQNHVESSELEKGNSWVIGDEGLSCSAVCSGRGKRCSSDHRFWMTFRGATMCRRSLDGAHSYDPSMQSRECGWLPGGLATCSSSRRHSGETQAGSRCDVRAPKGSCRICPCEDPSASVSSSRPRRIADSPELLDLGIQKAAGVGVIVLFFLIGAVIMLVKFGRGRRKRKGDYSRIPNVVEPHKQGPQKPTPQKPSPQKHSAVVDVKPSGKVKQGAGQGDDGLNGGNSFLEASMQRQASKLRLPPPLPVLADGHGGSFKLLPPPHSAGNGESRLDGYSPLSRSACQLSCLNLGDISGVYCDSAAVRNQGSFTEWPKSDDATEQEVQQARIHGTDGGGRLLLPQPSPASSEASTLADLANLELDVRRQPLRPLVSYS